MQNPESVEFSLHEWMNAHFLGWSIQTCMQSPESVAQKISEL